MTNRRPTGMIYSSTKDAMPCWQEGEGGDDGKGSIDAAHSHGGVLRAAHSKQKCLLLDMLIHFKFLRQCLLKNLPHHNSAAFRKKWLDTVCNKECQPLGSSHSCWYQLPEICTIPNPTQQNVNFLNYIFLYHPHRLRHLSISLTNTKQHECRY